MFLILIIKCLSYYYIYSYSNKKNISNEIDLMHLIKLMNNSTYFQKKIFFDINIRLSKEEKKFFSLILSKCKNYLEFGSGGTTLFAYNTPNIEKIITVESDKKWIKNISYYIKNYKNKKKLIFEYIDIGEISVWGYPASKKNQEKFSNYSKQVFKRYQNDYDLVFVDGRFRIACTLQVILNCKSDTKIMIHDFNNRPFYHILYKYLDIIYSVDTLALFSIKDDIDLKEVKLDYEKYKNDPK